MAVEDLDCVLYNLLTCVVKPPDLPVIATSMLPLYCSQLFSPKGQPLHAGSSLWSGGGGALSVWVPCRGYWVLYDCVGALPGYWVLYACVGALPGLLGTVHLGALLGICLSTGYCHVGMFFNHICNPQWPSGGNIYYPGELAQEMISMVPGVPLCNHCPLFLAPLSGRSLCKLVKDSVTTFTMEGTRYCI